MVTRRNITELSYARDGEILGNIIIKIYSISRGRCEEEKLRCLRSVEAVTGTDVRLGNELQLMLDRSVTSPKRQM